MVSGARLRVSHAREVGRGYLTGMLFQGLNTTEITDTLRSVFGVAYRRQDLLRDIDRARQGMATADVYRTLHGFQRPLARDIPEGFFAHGERYRYQIALNVSQPGIAIPRQYYAYVQSGHILSARDVEEAITEQVEMARRGQSNYAPQIKGEVTGGFLVGVERRGRKE